MQEFIPQGVDMNLFLIGQQRFCAAIACICSFHKFRNKNEPPQV